MDGKGKTVVVAVDESEESMRALIWACRYLLSRLEQQSYRLVLVHVEPDVSYAAGPAYILSTDVVNLLKLDDRRTTQKIFKRALAICSQNNVEPETEVFVGDAKERLCQAVQNLGADFLVVGSHGHGFFKRVILGSISDFCTQNAACPVIVVNKNVWDEIS